MNGQSIVIDLELPGAPEKVWRALTEPALLAKWLMDNDFQAVLGHRFNFRAPPGPHWDGVVHCEVLALEPNRRISYAWRGSGLDTVVTLTLEPAGPKATRLRLEQTGFQPKDAQAQTAMDGGWRENILPQLASTAATLA